MKLRKFNKSKSSKKIGNKNNNKIKAITIIISTIILILAILYFSFAKYESNQTYSLINATIRETLINHIKSLNTSDLQYDGIEVVGEIGTVNNNLRYIGPNPNNYIEFNNEKWRIVGIFDQGIKIIPDKELNVKMKYIIRNSQEELWENTQIKYYLNDDTSGFYQTLGKDTKKYIKNSLWSVGDSSLADYEYMLNASQQYKIEESKYVETYVGMLSASDILYSLPTNYWSLNYNDYDDDNNNDIFNLKLAGQTWINYDNFIWLINYNGSDYCTSYNIIGNSFIITGDYSEDYEYNLVPAIYLKKEVILTSGDGTSLNPYQIYINN